MSREPVRQYTDEIHRALGYWATWLPSVRIRLGDCGPITDRRLDPQTSLASCGIQFTSSEDDQSTDLQYVSDGAVTYTLQARGNPPRLPNVPKGKAGIKLSFSREDAVVLVARNVRQHLVSDIYELSERMYDRISVGEFPPDFAVVTNVLVADTATVLISSSASAEFVASADADMKAGLLDLASVNLGLSRVSSHHLTTEIVGRTSMTPMFKVIGLKKNGRFGLGKSEVGRLGFEELESDSVEVAEVEPQDADPVT